MAVQVSQPFVTVVNLMVVNLLLKLVQKDVERVHLNPRVEMKEVLVPLEITVACLREQQVPINVRYKVVSLGQFGVVNRVPS